MTRSQLSQWPCRILAQGTRPIRWRSCCPYQIVSEGCSARAEYSQRRRISGLAGTTEQSRWRKRSARRYTQDSSEAETNRNGKSIIYEAGSDGKSRRDLFISEAHSGPSVSSTGTIAAAKVTSARLAALHARLALPSKFPIEILARCLLDRTAESHVEHNNQTLALLGEDFLAYFASEAILCRFPRLPTDVLFSAMTAYVGPKALAALTREWGVEAAAAPGPEVDAGYLQFERQEAGNAGIDGTGFQVKDRDAPRPEISQARTSSIVFEPHWRQSVTSRTLYENEFGQAITNPVSSSTNGNDVDDADLDVSTLSGSPVGISLETASASFIRAVFGSIYLTMGFQQCKQFFQAHILSRHLDISTLFRFKQPTRDLSTLCRREGFDPPVARILSESGRQSRHPVYLVAIFSGREKLGEAVGASMDEARNRAAIVTMKSWYLYSPMQARVPSDTVGKPSDTPWDPLFVDMGEIMS